MRLVRSGRNSVTRAAARPAETAYDFARSTDGTAPLFAVGAPLLGAILAALSALLFRN